MSLIDQFNTKKVLRLQGVYISNKKCPVLVIFLKIQLNRLGFSSSACRRHNKTLLLETVVTVYRSPLGLKQ